MTEPDKPGLSNEEFIKKWKEVIPTAEFVPERGVKLSIFMQALDRLEALIRQGKPTPGQIGHELRPEDGPFKVEVDDHSDDCGTVYRLFGPSTSILHKDKDYLDEMAEHHNWGWYQAILSVSGQGQEERDYTPEEALAEARRRWGANSTVECVFFHHMQKFVMDVGSFTYDKSEQPSKIWVEHGRGETFRAAFASADKAQGGKGERDERNGL